MPGIAPRHPEQRSHSGRCPSGPDPPQPLLHEDAVVVVEGHHVCDRAHGDEVEERSEVRSGGAARAFPPPGAQRAEHVEHHPDPGEAFAREAVAGAVRIDHGVGGRQLRAGQVMVGDQDADAELLRTGNPLHARDTVVDGDDEAGPLLPCALHERRGQSVAVPAVRHHEPHVRGPEHA